MKRVLWVLVLSLFVGSCATVAPPQDLVTRALDALGGAESYARVKTISVKGSWKQWEPEQSFAPGGEARHANDATFETVADYGTRAVRTDWVKNFAYPAPRTFTFSEIVTPEAGYVIGREANGLNAQAAKLKSPAHSMSGLRLTTTQRELRRVSPLLLLEMRANPDRLSASPDIAIGGITYPALNYNAGAYTFTVMFDPQTGLPARIRTLDYDNVWGDVNYDVVLSDWTSMGGIRVPASQKYELNGRVVTEVKLTEVVVNPPVQASSFDPPAEIRAGAAKPATGNVPYQWILRRQFIGTYMDSENVSFDTRAASSLRLNEVAPGVQHQAGGTHHSLIVEMSDHLIVVDAPVTDYQSNWTIAAAQAKYPGKPIRFLVLTHHHMDHNGGIRAFAAQGATLVVGQGAGAHYRRVLAAPYSRNPDLAATRDLTGTRIMEVADRHVFSDGKREFSVHLLENPHSSAYLMAYVADARIAYVTDVYSPGVPLPPKMNPALQSVVNGVKKAGIQPVTFVGGHGSSAPYALLVGLAGQ
jgi:glyoxylase-like metal-dependent hydrolase (beta-lactamase superfamily II)